MLQTKYKTLTYNLQSADFVELKITVLIVIQFHVCNICQSKNSEKKHYSVPIDKITTSATKQCMWSSCASISSAKK